MASDRPRPPPAPAAAPHARRANCPAGGSVIMRKPRWPKRPSAAPRDVGRRRMHRQPRRRRLFHATRSQRPCRSRRRPRALRRARHCGRCAIRCCGKPTAPDGPASARLVVVPIAACMRLRELGIAPIAGLVHHGSGPRHTEPDSARASPPALAEFAAAVAARYPWIEYWTPVNEPLTTARFSALYGLWYPHAQRRSLVRRRAAQSMPGHGARDAGDPPSQPGGPTGADRRPQPHLRHRADVRRGRVLQRAPLAGLGPALRPRRSRAPALELPGRKRRRRGRGPVVRRAPVPARRHRRQLLRDQRALARSSRRTLSRAAARRPPRGAVRRRRVGARAGDAGARDRVAAAGSVAALSHSDRDHRGAHRRRARGPVALAARDLARRRERARGRRRRARRHRLVAARIVRLELPARRMPRLLRARAVRRARAASRGRPRSPGSSPSSPPAAGPAIRCCRATAGGAAPTASWPSRSCRARR